MDTHSESADNISPVPGTLVEMLGLRASLSPERIAYRFIISGDEAQSISYGELDRQSAGHRGYASKCDCDR